MRNITFAGMVRSFREETGLSMEELAIECGFMHSMVNLIENNGFVPRRETLKNLISIMSKHLCVSENELWLRAGYAPPDIPPEDWGKILDLCGMDSTQQDILRSASALRPEDQRQLARELRDRVEQIVEEHDGETDNRRDRHPSMEDLSEV